MGNVYNISESAKANSKKNGWGGARTGTGPKAGVNKITAKDLKENLVKVKREQCRAWVKQIVIAGQVKNPEMRKQVIIKCKKIMRASAAQMLNECLVKVYLNGTVKEQTDFLKVHGDRYMNTTIDFDEEGNVVKEDPLVGLADTLKRIKQKEDDNED